MADKIQNAYHDSKNIYDDVLTQGNIFGKLYIKLFWGGTDDNMIARKMLSWIPDDFAGKILDIPVGTAVFTHSKWNKLKDSEITCIDYSNDMIEQAKKRLAGNKHISCIQGDVGDLPFENENFDVVLCMNGVHAFPDKEKAYQEIYRVLKKGGKLIACFYIRGEAKITDWLVNKILSKKGWFTPPFQSRSELYVMLEQKYQDIDFYVDGAMVYFAATK